MLVPVAGRGEEHGLRGRVLASICRDTGRELTFVTVLAAAASDHAVAAAAREISELAEVKTGGSPKVEVLRSNDPVATLLEACRDYDLVVLGLSRSGWGKRRLGKVAVRVANEAPCPAILLSSRSTQLVAEVARPIKGVVAAVPRRSNRPPRI